MVVIGTLSWNVNVEGAAEAKAQVKKMEGAVEDTSEKVETKAEHLDSLSASYHDLEDMMGDTSQVHQQFEGSILATVAGYAGLREMMEETAAQSEEEQNSVLATIGVYEGLQSILGGTTDEEEEQETQSSFLTSGLFFLASVVGSLIVKYTALGGVLRVASTLLSGLARVVVWVAGLPLASWATAIGAAMKSGVLWVFRGIISLGSTLLAWGSSFVSWLAAGSAGALAFAASIGVIIGMIGVWILEITGVLDWIESLGEALSVSLPAWARDGLRAAIGIFSGGVAVLGALILGFVEGGFSGAWERASQMVDMFVGSFKRSFNRLVDWGAGVVDGFVQWFNDFKNDAIDSVTGFVDDALSAVENLGEDMSKHITEGLRGVFNTAIPETLEVPEITIGGDTIDAGPFGSHKLPSYTLGGQDLDMPQLREGGMVEETGVAQVHEGETYIPRNIREEMGDKEETGETKDVTVNVGGIELGDQSLDLSRMDSTELRNLAEKIAERLGTEVETLS